mmetsp:Transcript_17789/g.21922  ORF Transcript_17789/g.21922 Transcript_17789/m.21922 type:complete len:483 (-) Transcript_17789:2898-4346(-)
MAAQWEPHSWRKLPAKQQPKYENEEELLKCIEEVKRLPPIVATTEIDKLQSLLAECARGERFLLQGGDCAEQFSDCTWDTIAAKVKILLQMSFAITYGARIPTVRIGRLAGQFAKPRSSDFEILSDGRKVFSYRGDNVNGSDIDTRNPDPKRLLEGYFRSAATMNCARVVIAEGLADLRKATTWDMGFEKNTVRRNENEVMAQKIVSALDFIETCGVALDPVLRSVDMFVSHEGLHLPYEEALTRKSPTNGEYYNIGTHFLWIGDRTRQLDHGHVEYFRGIANPIGIKVGPTMKPLELVDLIEKVWPNPLETPGKVTLITRFGYDNVSSMLPPLIEAVKKANFPVVWICDPMHGNTTSTTVDGKKFKTRKFDSVLKELEECVKAHKESGSFLAGVHFELTGDNVTECTGGPENLTDAHLPERYNTGCDPRLNYAQSIEVAFRLAEYLLESRKSISDYPAQHTLGSPPGSPVRKQLRRNSILE